MKTIFISIFIAFLFVSCDNKDEFVQVDNQPDLSSEIQKVLVKTSKFTYYEISNSVVQTRGLVSNKLIKVDDYPEYDIYFNDNLDMNESEYEYKSTFFKEGKEVGVLYTTIEELENGYIFKYSMNDDNVGVSFLPKELGTRGLGDDVMDCITDVYSKRGWLSVLVWIETAFIPQTAVAMAVACTAANV